eukprot:CAMPEP_0197626272 /NCGR_PEP_ID=MMETSP1338-20131121/5317_1 /TAXON_ID=43686 ORGANISM="Pelagodinium beii, Strain RCC1491" /NCGR_SAMPLE_ID=MMETSP1338 /ASSEMBLY_ACC=CAM_ASM_000754 /LENGTH=1265 /DNA_ID=CAMNT_0043196801 /DNA_START=63 /DNA_END=3860 /DNA_ORIENTATION=+
MSPPPAEDEFMEDSFEDYEEDFNEETQDDETSHAAGTLAHPWPDPFDDGTEDSAPSRQSRPVSAAAPEEEQPSDDRKQRTLEAQRAEASWIDGGLVEAPIEEGSQGDSSTLQISLTGNSWAATPLQAEIARAHSSTEALGLSLLSDVSWADGQSGACSPAERALVTEVAEQRPNLTPPSENRSPAASSVAMGPEAEAILSAAVDELAITARFDEDACEASGSWGTTQAIETQPQSPSLLGPLLGSTLTDIVDDALKSDSEQLVPPVEVQYVTVANPSSTLNTDSLVVSTTSAFTSGAETETQQVLEAAVSNSDAYAVTEVLASTEELATAGIQQEVLPEEHDEVRAAVIKYTSWLVAAAVAKLQQEPTIRMAVEPLLRDQDQAILAAIKIQAAKRGNSERALVKKKRKQEADAAVHIQAVHRGKTDRARIAKQSKQDIDHAAGKDRLITKLLITLQGAMLDGTLETALADASNVLDEAATTKGLSADAGPDATPVKDVSARLQQRPSFEATQAAWRAGAGVSVKDLLADFQEEILLPDHPGAEISFGEGGFFISAGGGGLSAVLDEDEDAAFKVTADVDDDELTEATRRMYLLPSPKGDAHSLSAGFHEPSETLPTSAGEASGHVQTSIAEAVPACQAPAPASVSGAEDLSDQALTNLCIQLLAKEAVMKTVLRSMLNAEVRQASRTEASLPTEDEPKSSSVGGAQGTSRQSHTASASSLHSVGSTSPPPPAAGAPSGSSQGRGASTRSAPSRNQGPKKVQQPPATLRLQQQRQNSQKETSTGKNHRLQPKPPSQIRGRTRQPDQQQQDGSISAAVSKASETCTDALRQSSAPTTPRRPVGPKPTKPSPRSNMQAPSTRTTGEAEAASSGASRPPSQTSLRGPTSRPPSAKSTSSRNEAEKPKEKSEKAPEVAELWDAEKEHGEQVLPDDGIYSCEVSDAEFQLLVDAGVLQESYGFPLTSVDDQFEHLVFSQGGVMMHPGLAPEIQFQHPQPSPHDLGSYGFAAPEPQTQDYRLQGLAQQPYETMPQGTVAGFRQPTPPQAVQITHQQKSTPSHQGNSTGGAIHGAEAWGARPSESPDVAGDGTTEGGLHEKKEEQAADITKSTNSGKTIKKAPWSTSRQRQRRSLAEKQGPSCKLIFLPLDTFHSARPSDGRTARAAAGDEGPEVRQDELGKAWDAPALHQWEADAAADAIRQSSSASEYADLQEGEEPEDAAPVAGSAVHSARALRASRPLPREAASGTAGRIMEAKASSHMGYRRAGSTRQ